MKKRKKLALLLVGASVVVISCGGKGKDKNPAGIEEGQPYVGEITQTYLPYEGSLHLVNPNMPADNIVVENKEISNPTLVMKSYISGKQYGNLHPKDIVFIVKKENGERVIYKVNLELKGEAPEKKQVSSLKNACKFLGLWNDLNTGIGYLEVMTGGVDKNCNTYADNKIYLVHTGMSENDDAIYMDGKRIIDTLTNSKGQIKAFIVNNIQNRKLEICNTQFTSCKLLSSNYQNEVKEIGKSPDGTIYLCIDGEIYKVKDKNLEYFNATCSGFVSTFTDSEGIYAIKEGDIIKIPYNHSNATDIKTLYTGKDAKRIYPASMKDYLIVEIQASNSTNIDYVAINKHKVENPHLITSKDESGIHNVKIVYVSPKAVLYNKEDKELNKKKACIYNDKGENVCKDGYFVGIAFSPTGKFVYEDSMQFPYFLKVKGVLMANDTVNGTGGKLIIFTKEGVEKLDYIPDDYELYSEFFIGNTGLLQGIDRAHNQTDVFYINIENQNSLIQITDTLDKNEKPIYFNRPQEQTPQEELTQPNNLPQSQQQGETNPPQQGETNPPQQGETNPPQQGETNPPQQGETNPPQQGETNPQGGG